MRTEHDLIQLLDDEPPTPSAVDVRGAIATGRRRRAIRNAGFAGASVTALAVAGVVAVSSNLFVPGPAPDEFAGPVPVPTACTVQDPAGVAGSVVRGSDPTGRYLVGRTEPTAEAVLWRDGRGAVVDLPGAGRSALTGVNSSGTAVGWRFEADGRPEPVPFVVEDGKVSPLPGSGHGLPLAINDAGTIVGDSGGHPVRWSSATSEAVRLALPPGAVRGSAIDVDEDGTVVGDVDWKGFVWMPDGRRFALPLPEIGGEKASMSTIFGIRNGWVVGWAATTERPPSGSASVIARQTVSMRWNVHTGETKIFPATQLEPTAVSAEGWLVGMASGRGPVLVAGTTTLDLPLPGGAMAAADAQFSISDDGRTITGLIVDASAARRSVIWHCN
ncbi:hypothetical protein Q0Z83_015930 [Actinoplanes sichuanensis]|uniref:Uncharacterized protein n=1 Tax=Actinoplanes sichuanensis TaxID=512349 RepID=A0ABW4A825_9ACTN|nr:hypothetical protein [Actinoplanes sichuanensis]BEL03402.1 hypothetical protein Q0Z83_015930 [Actinoplanes sichuanensis]